MKTQLIVKYKTAKKLERKLKMQAHHGPTMIGTARKADLRIVGADVAAYHAAIESRGDEWFIYDMASDSGTWVDKENIIERKIEDEMNVRIGDHDFNFKVIPAPHTLFNFDERRNISPDVQEIVVKSYGVILETSYMRKDETFSFNNGFGGFTHLPPPPTTAWVYTEILGFTIQQRLRSRSKPLEEGTKKSLKEQRTYQAIVALGIIMICMGIYFFPKQPKMDVPDQNKYARLIYDSKVAKEKKKQATVQEKKMVNQGSKAAVVTKQLEQTLTKAGASQKTVKAISQIRASGLKNLLGRIAVRANMNADMIQYHGGGTKTSKDATAAFSGTSVSGPGFGTAKTAEKTVGIGTVATNGKGGGGTGYKGLGKLSQGEIGQAATVGMLDEEAEVSGGIDKDAIAEVIRSNIGQIRFCYERRLSAVPNLYGKVLVQFAIADGGTVQTPKVSQTTLSDSVVEGCILRRIASWKFPTPPAGTSVVVTYPFLFKSTQ